MICCYFKIEFAILTLVRLSRTYVVRKALRSSHTVGVSKRRPVARGVLWVQSSLQRICPLQPHTDIDVSILVGINIAGRTRFIFISAQLATIAYK